MAQSDTKGQMESIKWCQTNWHKVTQRDTKGHKRTNGINKMMTNKVKSENRLKHDTKWHKMTLSDAKWHKVTQSGTKWHKVAQSDDGINKMMTNNKFFLRLLQSKAQGKKVRVPDCQVSCLTTM